MMSYDLGNSQLDCVKTSRLTLNNSAKKIELKEAYRLNNKPMDEGTSIEDSDHKQCVRGAYSQKHCEGLKQSKGNLERNNVDLLVSEPMNEATTIEDSDQQHCVRDAHSQKHYKVSQKSERNLERNNLVFSVSHGSHRIHFINVCSVTPPVFSCAVDCFLEISFR